MTKKRRIVVTLLGFLFPNPACTNSSQHFGCCDATYLCEHIHNKNLLVLPFGKSF